VSITFKTFSLFSGKDSKSCPFEEMKKEFSMSFQKCMSKDLPVLNLQEKRGRFFFLLFVFFVIVTTYLKDLFWLVVSKVLVQSQLNPMLCI
jgi:hypothetical protein